MKRYLAFAHPENDYFAGGNGPLGGWDDLLGRYHTLLGAQRALARSTCEVRYLVDLKTGRRIKANSPPAKVKTTGGGGRREPASELLVEAYRQPVVESLNRTLWLADTSR